jgi:predicted CopG family antitoxin
MVITSIQVDVELLEELKKRKMYERESYADVIWDLIEDRWELSEETVKGIERSRREFKEGKYHTLDEVRKKIGLK